MALAPEPQPSVPDGADAPGLRLAPPPVAPTPAFDDLLAELTADGRLVHLRHEPPRAERVARLDRPLPPAVAAALGDEPLWSHQAEAIDLARAGTHVVVATGTASGKSRCFQLPIAEAVNDPIKPGTALVLYPTKALAHDQLRAWQELQLPGVTVATRDDESTIGCSLRAAGAAAAGAC